MLAGLRAARRCLLVRRAEVAVLPPSRPHVAGHGGPADWILAATVEEGIDLIVLGARRRRLFDLSVWGTTTERVVRHAPAPVWVVPGGGGG